MYTLLGLTHISLSILRECTWESIHKQASAEQKMKGIHFEKLKNTYIVMYLFHEQIGRFIIIYKLLVDIFFQKVLFKEEFQLSMRQTVVLNTITSFTITFTL